MQKNNLLELLTKLSQAAASLKQQANTENKESKTFSEQTATPKIEVEKIDRTKPAVPKTDAIIKMLRAHNEMSRRIIEEIKKYCTARGARYARIKFARDMLLSQLDMRNKFRSICNFSNCVKVGQPDCYVCFFKRRAYYMFKKP